MTVKIAACPNCARAVAIPDGLEESTVVECPICGQRFAVDDVIDEPAEAEDADELVAEVAVVGADDEEPEEEIAATAAMRVRCPCCGDEFPLDKAVVVETDRELGSEAVAALAADGTVREFSSDDGGMRFDFGDQVSATALPRIDDGEQLEMEADFEGAEEMSADSMAARHRLRGSDKSMLREIMGIVLGGAVGLLITYYGLNFFGGKRFDFLEIYLPGISHTSEHRPQWLPFDGEDGGDIDDQEPFDFGKGRL